MRRIRVPTWPKHALDPNDVCKEEMLQWQFGAVLSVLRQQTSGTAIHRINFLTTTRFLPWENP